MIGITRWHPAQISCMALCAIRRDVGAGVVRVLSGCIVCLVASYTSIRRIGVVAVVTGITGYIGMRSV